MQSLKQPAIAAAMVLGAMFLINNYRPARALFNGEVTPGDAASGEFMQDFRDKFANKFGTY